MPKFGPSLAALDLSSICLYCNPAETQARTWQEVPEPIKQTFTDLGIPAMEQYALAGVGAQYESEVIYKNLKQEWTNKGVIFCTLETAIHEYPELVCTYLGTLVTPADNKFAALNSAVWSGGSFIYVPKGVQVEMPIHAYFRMHQERMGQFERTLIIADQDSSVHYLEGCSAPLYSTYSLHSAVVEIFVQEHARVRYTTIQNWSTNVYNLVTKRAIAQEHATMEWIDGNIGSHTTMKYPSIILNGKHAAGTINSLSIASGNQFQSTGGTIIHKAAHTKASILSHSIAKDTGVNQFVGTIKIEAPAHSSQGRMQCNTIICDNRAQSLAVPTISSNNSTSDIGHEATVSTMDEQQLFYCASRGLTTQTATMLIINGFVSSFVEELPTEYAIELNRLLTIILTSQHKNTINNQI